MFLLFTVPFTVLFCIFMTMLFGSLFTIPLYCWTAWVLYSFWTSKRWVDQFYQFNNLLLCLGLSLISTITWMLF